MGEAFLEAFLDIDCARLAGEPWFDKLTILPTGYHATCSTSCSFYDTNFSFSAEETASNSSSFSFMLLRVCSHRISAAARAASSRASHSSSFTLILRSTGDAPWYSWRGTCAVAEADHTEPDLGFASAASHRDSDSSCACRCGGPKSYCSESPTTGVGVSSGTISSFPLSCLA